MGSFSNLCQLHCNSHWNHHNISCTFSVYCVINILTVLLHMCDYTRNHYYCWHCALNTVICARYSCRHCNVWRIYRELSLLLAVGLCVYDGSNSACRCDGHVVDHITQSNDYMVC